MFNIFKNILRPAYSNFKIFIMYFFNFYMPNYRVIRRKRVSFKSKPICSQKVKIFAQGIIEIGKGCSFGLIRGGYFRSGIVELQARKNDSKIVIGNNVWTNNNLLIVAYNYIEIGDNTLIGYFVSISDSESHGTHPDKRQALGIIGKVIIGRNVWIGSNVTILKNTYIGDNSIIATGAVVTGSFPSNVIIGGVPAKIIKSLDIE